MFHRSCQNGNVMKYLLSGIFWLYCTGLFAQQSVNNDSTWLEHVLKLLHEDQEMDSEEKSALADSAFHVAANLDDVCKQVHLRIKQATYLDNMGLADSALVQLFWAQRQYHHSCDSILLMSLFRNLTNVYLSLDELPGVDSVGSIALRLWNPNWKEKDTRFAVINNMAISKAMQGDMEAATKMFHQAYKESQKAGDNIYIQKSLINLGSIKGMTRDLDSAYYFFLLAVENEKASGTTEDYTGLLINLADLEKDRGNYNHGLILLDSAYVLAEKIKSTEHLANTQETRAKVYAAKQDFANAYNYLLKYLELREQILNEEKIKSVTEMMEKYESEKKARQIQDLEIDKLDATLRNERVTNARNRFLIIGIIILLAAGGLWNRLRFVSRTRKAIQKEKDISEGLLLNILPGSVAEELKMKGFAEAKHFESATILFSDFKNFTTFASGMNAADLVEELNVCFKAFDAIMTKYGIEKIKTIGDAYMAAGGIPDTNRATVADVVNAGLDMQQFVKERKRERELTGLEGFEMRIGIHSGPVVAGIVGVKKFQYDLWGDTVNIASRMETNGKPGQVNISEATYKLIHQDPSFSFISRGMIHAKGKGQLAMYFVSHAKTAEAIIS